MPLGHMVLHVDHLFTIKTTKQASEFFKPILSYRQTAMLVFPMACIMVYCIAFISAMDWMKQKMQLFIVFWLGQRHANNKYKASDKCRRSDYTCCTLQRRDIIWNMSMTDILIIFVERQHWINVRRIQMVAYSNSALVRMIHAVVIGNIFQLHCPIKAMVALVHRPTMLLLYVYDEIRVRMQFQLTVAAFSELRMELAHVIRHFFANRIHQNDVFVQVLEHSTGFIGAEYAFLVHAFE